ncbi:MAG: hypothetical protein RLZZ262_2508 [Bacteroidota bacterium]|jgi:hypothetical protein
MNVLIVNYDFPPNAGIGGRRWAKLAKGLAMTGHNVFVIKASALDGQASSPWLTDVTHERIKVIDVPRAYPTVMQRPVRSLLDRIKYRIARWKLEQTAKGTIYDISLGWTHGLNNALNELNGQHTIEWILTTGAPWNMLYDVANWKQKHQHVKLLVDFRDPWINARNYGMSQLTGERLAWEKHKQNQVLLTADVVTTPYAYLTRALREFSPDSKANFTVLTHFFDQEDMPPEQPNDHSVNLHFVYGGEMYVECDGQLQWLRERLHQLRTEQPELYERVRFDFYSPTDRSDIFMGLENVSFHAPIGKAIFQRCQKADGLILLLTPSKKDDLTTKFFEYLPLAKPLVALGVEGEVSKFVSDENLGPVWTSDMTYESWKKTLEDLHTKKYTTSFDYNQYELGPMTQKLLALLQ